MTVPQFEGRPPVRPTVRAAWTVLAALLALGHAGVRTAGDERGAHLLAARD
jgi:hypothetical protein